jgi:polar amino acid transport system substrate-binding protein
MMKKLLATVLFTLCLPLASFAKPNIVLATTQWEPYVSANALYHGYAYDIVKQAYEAAGYNVTIKFMDWDNAIAAAQNGQVDAVFPEYFSKSRATDFKYSKPFSGGPIGFFKKKGSAVTLPDTKSKAVIMAEIAPYKIGVVKGYVNFPELDNAKNLQTVAVDNDKDNLVQLFQGKVQLAVIDKVTADYLLNHKLPNIIRRNVVFVQPAMAFRNIFVIAGKANPTSGKTLKAFNKGLSIIKRNGTLAKIMDKDARRTGLQFA